MGKRGEEEIAEIVANETPAGVKTILEKAAEKGFVFRKSNHAIANVTRRENAVFTAQTAGAAAVISDRDNGSEIGDGPFGAGVLVVAANHVFFEAAEEGGKSGATSKS